MSANNYNSFNISLILQDKMQRNYFKGDDEFEPFDVHELFLFYNSFFFRNILEKCSVQWSQRMTLCAGSCANTYGISCVIKLSAPLLKYRTSNQLKQTLLHEMIHAYLFITNPRACQTEGGHGKEFKEIMNNINSVTGLNVTVFHNFNDEVNMYRKHIWRCNGICRERPPFFGYVRRTMNRKPQPADRWFNDHQKTCGGTFFKQSEPEEVQKRGSKGASKTSKEKRGWGTGKTIEDYFKQMEGGQERRKVSKPKNKKIEDYFKPKQKGQAQQMIPFQGRGVSLSDYSQQLFPQNQSLNHDFK